MSKQTTRWCAPWVLVGAGASLLGACSIPPHASPNDDLTVGDAYTPAAFLPAPPPVGAASVEAVPMPAPSVLSIDRSNWGVTPVPVPVAWPKHRPIYTRNPVLARATERNAGKHPTLESSLQRSQPEDAELQLAEAVVAPGAAALDLLLFPVRVWRPLPWRTVRTVDQEYRRAPVPNPYPPVLFVPPASPEWGTVEIPERPAGTPAGGAR